MFQPRRVVLAARGQFDGPWLVGDHRHIPWFAGGDGIHDLGGVRKHGVAGSRIGGDHQLDARRIPQSYIVADDVAGLAGVGRRADRQVLVAECRTGQAVAFDVADVGQGVAVQHGRAHQSDAFRAARGLPGEPREQPIGLAHFGADHVGAGQGLAGHLRRRFGDPLHAQPVCEQQRQHGRQGDRQQHGDRQQRRQEFARSCGHAGACIRAVSRMQAIAGGSWSTCLDCTSAW